MPPKRKGTLRSASKVQEAELLARVRVLRDRPELVLPACEGNCVFFCPFRAARKHAAKALAAKDDPVKLKRLAKRGNRIGRAFAAALLAAHSEAVSHLAQARLPFGTYPYIYRGEAKPKFHVAVQHHPDRRLRLLGAAEYAERRNLVVYSLAEGMVTTHRRFAPPPEFVALALEDADLIRRDDSLHTCPHPTVAPAIVLRWHSAGVVARVCGACAGDRSTFQRITSHIAAKNLARDFAAEVELPPIENLADSPAPDTGPARRYLASELTDRAFLTASEESRLERLRARDGFLLVTGSRSYPDAGSLAAALGSAPAEARALEAALQGWDRPIVVPRASAALVLEAVWPTRGRAALEAASGSKEAADDLFDETATASSIPEILRRAAATGVESMVARALPRYRTLPPPAELANRAARAFRTRGKEAAIPILTDSGVPSGPTRGVALAFLEALGEARSHAWRFAQVEQELAAHLASEASSLLHGPTTEYHAALSTLSAKAGSGEISAP